MSPLMTGRFLNLFANADVSFVAEVFGVEILGFFGSDAGVMSQWFAISFPSPLTCCGVLTGGTFDRDRFTGFLSPCSILGRARRQTLDFHGWNCRKPGHQNRPHDGDIQEYNCY